jgi:hypothetical protein
MDRMEDMGFAYLWAESLPRVADWLGRMQARPAYQSAYYKGSRLSDQFPDLKLGKGARRAAAASAAPVV